jgi:4-hydroxyacetophenone monooxygenase
MTSAAPGAWGETSGSLQELQTALQDANIPTLLLVLQHLTGDPKWTREPYRPVRGKPLDDNDSGGLFAEVQEQVRQAALQAVIAVREGRLTPTTPEPEEIARMLSCALVEDVPAEYGELLAEEMGFVSRRVNIPASTIPEGFRVVVIGAGLSGLCMAIELDAAGIDYVVLEKDPDLGGVSGLCI